MLERYNLADKTVEINHAGAEISKSAAGGQAAVFASIGPSGKMLSKGDVGEEELYEVFLEQAEALSSGGADGIVIETMTDLAELSVAMRAAKSTGLTVAASMVFDSGVKNESVMTGITPEEAVAAMETEGIDIVATNCGRGIEEFLPICKRYRAVTDLPIWIKPNAGLPKMINGRAVYTMSPEEFAAYMPALVEAGANFVGGCCGTNPEFIRAVVESLR
jgi:methionine synthase I (cobalamin-dependent)